MEDHVKWYHGNVSRIGGVGFLQEKPTSVFLQQPYQREEKEREEERDKKRLGGERQGGRKIANKIGKKPTYKKKIRGAWVAQVT